MTSPRIGNRSSGLTRSAGAAAGRGMLLIVFALALGVLLLARALDDGSDTEVSTGSSQTTVTEADDEGTGSSAAPETTAAPVVTAAPIPQAHPPAQVTVIVFNARQVQGIAAANYQALLAKGYNVFPATNAPTVELTNVYFTDPAFAGDAVAVAKELGIPEDRAVVLSDPATVGADTMASKVVVVLGKDGLGLQAG